MSSVSAQKQSPWVETVSPRAHEFRHNPKKGPQKTPKFMGSLPHDRAHITCWLGSGCVVCGRIFLIHIYSKFSGGLRSWQSKRPGSWRLAPQGEIVSTSYDCEEGHDFAKYLVLRSQLPKNFIQISYISIYCSEAEPRSFGVRYPTTLFCSNYRFRSLEKSSWMRSCQSCRRP